MIKQWFMWVKPNFENVGTYSGIRPPATWQANISSSMSIRSGRMRMLSCRRGLKIPSQSVGQDTSMGRLKD